MRYRTRGTGRSGRPGRDRILGAVERDADIEHRARERVLVEVRIGRVVDDVARRRHVGAHTLIRAPIGNSTLFFKKIVALSEMMYGR